ncbi:hypothetical protein BKA62DRAFT_833077 [Auriculariales sp. MPI-PUGE-AT-0066]|nr:hypothetical protein BKA62DRAFT_833077 [Auriculariales sp. MPI-PUGE-AT-0066]
MDAATSNRRRTDTSLHTRSAKRASIRRMAAVFVCSVAWLQAPAPVAAHEYSQKSPALEALHGVRQAVDLQGRQTDTGNTTCLDRSVTWYNNEGGLNPCQQYEKLRQICQPSFLMPKIQRPINTAQPPTTCDSQFPDCCCNSVAFNLAMTCAACQAGDGSGRSGDLGTDAPAGTYQAFLGDCIRSSVNKTLPEVTQQAVCNKKLDLPAYPYNVFWADGAMYFQYTLEWTVQRNNANLSSSGLCGGTTFIADTTDTSPTTGTGPDKNVIIAIVGGVLGALGLVSTLVVLFWVRYRNKHPKQRKYPPPPMDFDLGPRDWRAYRDVPSAAPSPLPMPLIRRDSSSVGTSIRSSHRPDESGSSSLRGSGALHPAYSSGSGFGHTPGQSVDVDLERYSSTPLLTPGHSSRGGSGSFEVDLDPFLDPGSFQRERERDPRRGRGTARDEKLRVMERHPDGKAPLPFELDETSASGSSRAGESSSGRKKHRHKSKSKSRTRDAARSAGGRELDLEEDRAKEERRRKRREERREGRRDEKLRQLEVHPDGKPPVPFTSATGSSSSGPEGAGKGKARAGARPSSPSGFSQAPTQRPPSYATNITPRSPR